MTQLYDYYGLILGFKKELHIPIRVYAMRNEQVSCIQIEFKDGLLSSMTSIDLPNPLDTGDQLLFKLLIEKNLSELLKLWLNVFLYNKKVEVELLTGKILE